jgi:hypothetical protein
VDQDEVGEIFESNESNWLGFKQPFRLVKRCRISVLVRFCKSVNSRMLYH